MSRQNIHSVSATPTISTSAYSVGDAVGGLITLTNALVKVSFSGTIKTVTLSDASKQNAVIQVTFFSSSPTTATITDNAALVIPVAELTKVIGTVSIESANYSSYSASSFATVECNLGVKLTGEGSTIYACLSTDGAPTYATTSALTLGVAILQD